MRRLRQSANLMKHLRATHPTEDYRKVRRLRQSANLMEHLIATHPTKHGQLSTV
ncbi:MAG: hypothetical protein HC789_13785 [Microcoleus sp. CSU_2_2]|nr:hypothetical protein [Microcoleus sp. CSU_2_2]